MTKNHKVQGSPTPTSEPLNSAETLEVLAAARAPKAKPLFSKLWKRTASKNGPGTEDAEVTDILSTLVQGKSDALSGVELMDRVFARGGQAPLQQYAQQQASLPEPQPRDEAVPDAPREPAAVSPDPHPLKNGRNAPKKPVPVNRSSWLQRLLRKTDRQDEGSTLKPIAILFGFLPNVREQDAREYALGYAAEFLQTHGTVFFQAFPYKSGYAFEVHQGGEGRAFLPSILRYFDAQGEFEPGEQVQVIVDTATRKAQVFRTRDGIDFVLLPEDADKEPTDWLRSTSAMTPAVNKMTAYFIAGAVMFATGFIAMMVTSLITRYQEVVPVSPPAAEIVSLDYTPSGQWKVLNDVPPTSYISALRFRKGKWEAPEVTVDTELLAQDGSGNASTQAESDDAQTTGDAK